MEDKMFKEMMKKVHEFVEGKMDLNEFIFCGNVFEKPHLLENENGTKYCELLLESDFSSKKEYTQILCLEPLAEELCKKAKEGERIMVKGHHDFEHERRFVLGKETYKVGYIGESAIYND